MSSLFLPLFRVVGFCSEEEESCTRSEGDNCNYYFMSVLLRGKIKALKWKRYMFAGKKKKKLHSVRRAFPRSVCRGGRKWSPPLKTWSSDRFDRSIMIILQRTRNEWTVRLIDPLCNCELFIRAPIEKSSRALFFFIKSIDKVQHSSLRQKRSSLINTVE